MAEEQVYGKGVRPWRKWEGCTTFGDILVCAVAKVAEDGVLHTEEEMKDGRSREVARAPAACCIAKGCSYHTKRLSGEDAVNALWGHLSTSSANEAEAFKKSQDRSKLLHPTKPMIEQLNYHWQKEDAAAQERSLAAQGFSVDGERLKESRKIVGLPRAPAIGMHPPLRKGPGTGAPPQNQRRAAGAGEGDDEAAPQQGRCS